MFLRTCVCFCALVYVSTTPRSWSSWRRNCERVETNHPRSLCIFSYLFIINSEICSNFHRRRAGSLRRSILATIRPTRPRSEGFRVPSCPIVPWCFWSDKTFANVSSKLKMVCGLCQECLFGAGVFLCLLWCNFG